MKKLQHWKPRSEIAHRRSELVVQKITACAAVIGLLMSAAGLLYTRFDIYETNYAHLIIESARFIPSDLGSFAYIRLKNTSASHGTELSLSAYATATSTDAPDYGIEDEVEYFDHKPMHSTSTSIGRSEARQQLIELDPFLVDKGTPQRVEKGEMYVIIRVLIEYRDAFFIQHHTQNCYVLRTLKTSDKPLERCAFANLMD